MKYRKTTDPKKMMTNAQFDDALQNDFENLVKDVGYNWYRTSTYISYKAGETKALVWNEGETEETEIELPLEDNWYLVENKYGIPNGREDHYMNYHARFLWWKQDSDYTGPLVRYVLVIYDARRRVAAYDGRDGAFGVEKIEETEREDNRIKVTCICGDPMTCKQRDEAQETTIGNQITIIQEYKTILQQAYQLISCKNRGKTGTKLCVCEGCEVKREILKLVGEKHE